MRVNRGPTDALGQPRDLLDLGVAQPFQVQNDQLTVRRRQAANARQQHLALLLCQNLLFGAGSPGRPFRSFSVRAFPPAPGAQFQAGRNGHVMGDLIQPGALGLDDPKTGNRLPQCHCDLLKQASAILPFGRPRRRPAYGEPISYSSISRINLSRWPTALGPLPALDSLPPLSVFVFQTGSLIERPIPCRRRAESSTKISAGTVALPIFWRPDRGIL